MSPRARAAHRIYHSRPMVAARLEASLAQTWRRRLAADGGPAAWAAFKAMYEGEIDERRRRLASEIREIRRLGGLGSNPFLPASVERV